MATDTETAKDRPEWWQSIRAQMPVAERWAYFDHAGVSPIPEPVRQAIREWADHFAEDGVVDWGAWRQKIERVRQLAAARLQADESEIALIRNTTEGISLVAEGFPWRAGDNVVVPDSEFPSNLYPWLNLQDRGVEVRQVECREGQIDPGALAAACNARTRVVAVSWVGYATGWRCDLEAVAQIAHRRGALFIVDAIQGLGVLELDVSQTPVDVLAADGHKWLLGPEGAGVMYVRQECLNVLRPLGVGWNSVVQAGNFADKSLRIKADASRYEGGTHNMAGYLGLAASLSMFEGTATAAIERRLREVTDLCRERLQSAGTRIVSAREEPHWSGIIAVELPGCDPFAVKRHCLRQGVVVNTRDGWLRLSPHVYTSAEDVERLMGSLPVPGDRETGF